MINTHPKMLDEILSQANDSANPETSLKNASNQDAYVKRYLQASVDDVWTTIDVAGMSPKQNDYHRSMAGAFLLNRHTITIFNTVLLGNEASDDVKLRQYKALIEMLFPSEADILKAVLSKNLASLYPNLTHEVISNSLGN